MKAVVMAGGKGQRLQPLTRHIPKSMIPILNLPLLLRTVNFLKHYNFSEFIFLLYHFPESIIDFFGNGERFGVAIEYIEAQANYGTAGAVKLAEGLVGETFLVFSGDILSDLNLDKFCRFHKEKGGLATLALASADDPTQFGSISVDSADRITRFVEKPSIVDTPGNVVNAGIYLLEPEVLRDIPAHTEYYFAKDMFPRMLRQGENFYGFSGSYYWRDIGNPASYRVANMDALQRRIKLPSTSGDCLAFGHALVGKATFFFVKPAEFVEIEVA